MEQPEGGGPNTYGKVKVAASRCPAPRDSPALARQEGDDWPHTPFITLPLRRLPFPPTLSLTSTIFSLRKPSLLIEKGEFCYLDGSIDGQINLKSQYTRELERAAERERAGTCRPPPQSPNPLPRSPPPLGGPN